MRTETHTDTRAVQSLEPNLAAALQRQAAAEAAFAESQAIIANSRGKGPSVIPAIRAAVALQQQSRTQAAAAKGEVARLSVARKQQATSRTRAPAAAAAPARPPAETGQAEILLSLDTLGALAKDPEAAKVLDLARNVGLKGFTAAQEPSDAQAEILLSLDSMGALAKDPEVAKVLDLARRVGLKGFTQ